MKKKYLLMAIILLNIGFATVVTTLFINGGSRISSNSDEFNVYFSKVKVDGVEDNSLVSDDTHIVFEEEFKSFGDTHEVEYYITNGSINYDSKVSVSCSEGNDYVEVTSDWVDEIVIDSIETKSGKLTMSLKRTYTGDTSLNLPVTCELTVTATERDTKGTGTPAGKVEQKINLFNLIKNQAKSDTIDFSIHSGTSGTNGVYITTETEGNVPVYYFRGSHKEVNNNIIFNNMCWKIIRTTETGGVKLIYNGTPNAAGECEALRTDTQIGESEFNTNDNDNAYVGYMYGTPGSSTYAATHANTNDSTIKTKIDTWYTVNFDEIATAKLEDTVFCNDRSTTTETNNNTLGSAYGSLGYGTNATSYGAAARSSYDTQVPKPSLVCANVNDKFTVSSTNGNGALTNPVGLITLDEVILAGYNTHASNKSDYINSTNYLTTGEGYWTFSPVGAFGDLTYACVGFVRSTTGDVSPAAVQVVLGVRPVVSLANGTLVGSDGEGTSTKPYVVS